MRGFRCVGTRWLEAGARTAAACVILAALATSVDARAQRAFGSAEDAIQVLVDAVAADDQQAILEILGTQYEDRLVTSDWGAEQGARAKIAAAAQEKLAPNQIADGRVEWLFGAAEWPLPFQTLRAKDGKWHFDTEAGIEAVIDRRIGRNELAAIAIVNAYVDAQIAYAKEDRDDDGVYEYAQRLTSTKGKRDGLFWESAPGEPESPLGPLVSGAESYLDQVAKGDPIYGYYFRVLDRQGANPPGGAYDYVINGNMIAGFALVAYPAEYGNTGVMTFVVNHRGKIQQKAIGDFDGMAAYDPDDSWEAIAVEP